MLLPSFLRGNCDEGTEVSHPLCSDQFCIFLHQELAHLVFCPNGVAKVEWIFFIVGHLLGVKVIDDLQELLHHVYLKLVILAVWTITLFSL